MTIFVQVCGHGLEEQGAPALDTEHEVVGEARNYDTTINCETIYYKCRVVEGGVGEQPGAFTARNKKDKFPVYLHRFDMQMVKRAGKSVFSLEPVVEDRKTPSKRQVLEERKTPSKRQVLEERKTPSKRQVLEEKKTPKRQVLEERQGQDTPRTPRVGMIDVLKPKIRDSPRGSPSPSELSSFVTGVAGGDTPEGLNGGYWGVQGGKRTPKPKVKGEVRTPGSRLKEKLVETELSTSSGRKLKIKFGTQMEMATGSGRKVTLKCGGGEKTKFAPSSGLAAGQITSLLDSDTEESAAAATKVSRKRRASVSCTTPAKTSASATTTPRKIAPAKRRPASEVKRRPASEVKAGRRSVVRRDEDSDDDFTPVVKVGRGRRVESRSQEPESSSEESEEEEEEESEEEDEPAAKKKRRVSSVNKSSSAKSSAGQMKATKRVFKPSVAPRSAPLPSNVAPLAAAQQRLHVSAVPESLPCREEEFAEIFTYIESKLREGRGGCYYISGVPGTGKTATVMEAVRMLQENREDYPDFNFYSMNGMRLTSPEQAYVEMWKLLTGEKATPEHAMKLLAARFSKAAPKRNTSVFLVDELDMLCNRKQSVLYNIFDWPSKPEGKLIIIAIANTMDLPERVMINRVSSRLGLTRQTFQPYTHEQLQTIVASRLEGLEVFEANAVQLVARKVASLSGDARRALDICRRSPKFLRMAL